MSTTLRPIYLIILILGSLISCAPSLPTYVVNVDAYKGTEYSIPPGSRFYVYLDSDENDLMKHEIRRKIEYSLKYYGWSTGGGISESDYVLFFAYGIKSGTENYTKYVYDPGTPVKSNSTPSTGSAAGDFLSGFAKGFAESSQRMRPQQAQREVNHRYLTLAALEIKALRNGEKKVVWQADTKSSGSSSDLRYVLNFMLVPTLKLIGKGSGKALQYRIKEDNPIVTDMIRNSRL